MLVLMAMSGGGVKSTTWLLADISGIRRDYGIRETVRSLFEGYTPFSRG